MNEMSKALTRRLHDSRYATRYFRGVGIDIGAGDDSIGKYAPLFPLITGIKAWDVNDGDAQYLASVPDQTFDFVHSSHCLEHMHNPFEAFRNWIRVCKPGGYLVITIPDEDLYEQGIFPSTFNGDHKVTFTINKRQSWSPNCISIFALLNQFSEQIQILKIELIDETYVYDVGRIDQTLHGMSESAIELVVRRLTSDDITRSGRYSTA